MMGWGSILRLSGYGLFAAALFFSTMMIVDRFHQKDLADRAARCEAAAIEGGSKLDDCGVNVRARVEAARQAQACETALTPQLRPETRFAARLACGPGTLRLIAQGEADAARIAGVEAENSRLRTDGAAALARAEARGRTEQTRRDNARLAIETAPRGADGGIACDAACLRRIAD